MKNHLPFRAIVAFEVVSRLGSVTRAANELGVTQSAVSRQIAALEAHVGGPLFLRIRRRLQLTVQGRELFEKIAELLKGIETALRSVSTSPDGKRLTIATHATFALKWLIPRLARFKSQHPDIELRLKVSPEEVDFARDRIDGAVQYTPFVGRDFYSRRLCESVLLPVCHPHQFPELQRMVARRTLSALPLIHTRTRPNDWPRWLQHFGIEASHVNAPLVFENSFLAYEAARKALGIAIAHRSMVIDDLQSGLLKTHQRFALPIDETFHFVTPNDQGSIEALLIFEEWLAAEFIEREPARTAMPGKSPVARTPRIETRGPIRPLRSPRTQR